MGSEQEVITATPTPPINRGVPGVYMSEEAALPGLSDTDTAVPVFLYAGETGHSDAPDIHTIKSFAGFDELSKKNENLQQHFFVMAVKGYFENGGSLCYLASLGNGKVGEIKGKVEKIINLLPACTLICYPLAIEAGDLDDDGVIATVVVEESLTSKLNRVTALAREALKAHNDYVKELNNKTDKERIAHNKIEDAKRIFHDLEKAKNEFQNAAFVEERATRENPFSMDTYRAVREKFEAAYDAAKAEFDNTQKEAESASRAATLAATKAFEAEDRERRIKSALAAATEEANNAQVKADAAKAAAKKAAEDAVKAKAEAAKEKESKEKIAAARAAEEAAALAKAVAEKEAEIARIAKVAAKKAEAANLNRKAVADAAQALEQAIAAVRAEAEAADAEAAALAENDHQRAKEAAKKREDAAATLAAYRKAKHEENIGPASAQVTVWKNTWPAILEACEASGRVFALLDLPDDKVLAQELLQHLKHDSHASTLGCGAGYWPHVVVEGGHAVLPSGMIAASIEKTDRERGIWKAPANVVLTNAYNTSKRLAKHELLIENEKDLGFNVIRVFPGRGVKVWGCRTLMPNQDTTRSFVQSSRMASYIENSILNIARFAVFEPNNEITWVKLHNIIYAWLHALWLKGGLVGASEAEAFSVLIGRDVSMTDDDIAEGRLNVNVSFALQRPLQFITLTLRLTGGEVTVSHASNLGESES